MRNKMNQGSAILLSIIIVFGSSGCESEQKAWEEAKKADSILRYQKFLKDYPKRKYRAEVYFRIAEVRNTIKSYELFLKKRIDKGVFAKKARAKLEKLYYESAENYESAEIIDVIAVWEDYIRRYPVGAFTNEAKKKLEKLYFMDACQKSSIKAYQDFLIKYPVGSLADKARERLAEIRKSIHPLLIKVKTVKFKTTQHYHRSGNLRLKLAQILAKLPLGINLRVVGKGEEEADLIIDIKLNGKALSKTYGHLMLGGLDAKTRYSGARVWGSISLKIKGKIVLKKTFSGRHEAPDTISENDFMKPDQAPYSKTLYLKNSLVQKYFEAMGSGFGYSVLYLPFRSWERKIATCAADALIKLRGNNALEIFSSLPINKKYYRLTGIEGMGKLKTNQAAKALMALLEDRREKLREAVVKQLGNFTGDNVIERLIVVLQEDEADSVRRQAAELLGKSRRKKVIPPLVAALQDKYIMVRMEAAWALGEIGDFRAVAPLINNLKRKNPIYLEKSLKALGKIKDDKTIPLMIKLLKSSRNKYLKIGINNALKKISGQKFKPDWQAWSRWWEKSKKGN